MSKLSDYAGQITGYSDQINTGLEGVGTSLDDIKGDLKFLNDKLTEIQNSAGDISPEDQASLDAALGRLKETSDKADAAKNKSAEVAALNPPAPPADGG